MKLDHLRTVVHLRVISSLSCGPIKQPCVSLAILYSAISSHVMTETTVRGWNGLCASLQVTAWQRSWMANELCCMQIMASSFAQRQLLRHLTICTTWKRQEKSRLRQCLLGDPCSSFPRMCVSSFTTRWSHRILSRCALHVACRNEMEFGLYLDNCFAFLPILCQLSSVCMVFHYQVLPEGQVNKGAALLCYSDLSCICS